MKCGEIRSKINRAIEDYGQAMKNYQLMLGRKSYDSDVEQESEEKMRLAKNNLHRAIDELEGHTNMYEKLVNLYESD